MKTLTRREIVKLVSRHSGANPYVVKDVFEQVLHLMESALLNGRKIEIRNFGAFEPVVRKAKIGQWPGNTAYGPIKIPSRITVKFRPGHKFLSKLNS